ncbi:unnamed protein product [Ostreobium quekettii]|uniref:Protein kinase domain-containing protein n=1 Tax=Ostreobium quekettii TaxID=121088 RepID=A0A8S1ILB8_9CHLO|nr:unnamed protein product [Ostreobium quekettii]
MAPVFVFQGSGGSAVLQDVPLIDDPLSSATWSQGASGEEGERGLGMPFPVRAATGSGDQSGGLGPLEAPGGAGGHEGLDLEPGLSAESSKESWVVMALQRRESVPSSPSPTGEFSETERRAAWVVVQKGPIEMGPVSPPSKAEGGNGKTPVCEVANPAATTAQELDVSKTATCEKAGAAGSSPRAPSPAKSASKGETRQAGTLKGEAPAGDDNDPLCGMNLSISWDELRFDRPRVLLGEGAFGTVFRGQYGGRPVAVKKFSPSSGQVANTDTMANELRILGAAGPHENLVHCYGGCLEGPNVFIVEELMDKSLHDLVHSSKWGAQRLPVRQILRLAMDITAGLCHLHPKIMHRDLKPQNILLTREGRAKVADFGLSRTKATTYLKTRDQLAGTIAYIAPECINGGHVTHKSDLYSLGIILWECLTGLIPFSDYDQVFAIMFGVANNGDRPQFPEDVHCPPGLRELICECWSQDPRARPSCEEVMIKLRELELNLFGDKRA